MITKKLNLALIAILIAGTTCVTSCKKKTTTPEPQPVADSDQSGASANSTAENISSDMVSIGSEACDISGNGSLSTYRSADANGESLIGCATVVRDTVAKTVVVTFNGGTCLDGKVRTGSITYNYSASTNNAKRYRHPGFNLSITSNNYAVDGNTVTITNKTIANTTPIGFNPLTTNLTWSISANITIALAEGGTINWTCSRVKTLLNTATAYVNSVTPIAWSTAKIGFTGSASGTRSNGETFNVAINSQLIRDIGGCSIAGKHPFIQGVLVYTPGGKSSRTFDYGPGTCDLNATVTIDNVTYPFTLH